MFNRMSLKAKLICSFTMVAAVTALVAGVNYYYTETIDAEYAYVTEQKLPNIQNVYDMRVETVLLSTFAAKMGMDLSEGHFDPKLQAAVEKSVKTRDTSAEAYMKIPFTAGEEDLWKKYDTEWNAYVPLIMKAMEIAQTANKERYAEFAQLVDTKVEPAYEATRKAARDLLDFHDKAAEEANAQAGAHGEQAILISSVLGVVGVLLSVALGWFVASYLGNSLAAMVTKVEASSTDVASAATQIASSSTELSESSTEQAAAIQETAASVDEVSAMIKKNSENAERSQNSSVESREIAESGSRQVETMMQSIGAISEANERIMRQVEEGNREISEIVKVITEIGQKTKVINDIVFQTKLLSFNASVEAARAGEHGKGFAVVAEEVGNLAQMSGNAAKEITDMLDNSVKKVEGIVVRTKESVAALIADAKHKVESGTEVARGCGDALEKILGSVKSVDQLVTEIAHASKEQATGMNEITRAMSELDKATSQNSTVSQQCAAASEQLSGQAQAMNQLVGELNSLLYGAGASSAPVAARAKAVKRQPAVQEAKVIPMKKASRTADSFPLKAAAGSDLPAANDPRFEDV